VSSPSSPPPTRAGAEPKDAPRAPSPSRLSRFFAALVAKRWLVIALYSLILPPSAYYAAKVGQDNSIDQLMVPSDPDYVETRAFEKIFGAGEYAVLVIEADDPLSPPVLERVDRLETALRAIPRVEVNSALSVFRRAKAGFSPTPEQCEAFRKFVTGTEMFREQGLTGDRFLSMALVLDVHGNEQRGEAVSAIDRAIQETGAGAAPVTALRKVGQPYVNEYFDDATKRAGPRSFGLFMVLVVVLTVALFRSARTLIAFLLTLGACMATSVGYIGLTGGSFTVVSPMVPMTILVTATATLVYLHSRFAERPEGSDVDEHQVFALTNKFLACTASIFATAVGFAALAISNIRPIRQMGIWVAVGLAFTWIIVFTLFPALQKILKTPTRIEKKPEETTNERFLRFTAWLPGWTYRWRWPLVLVSIALSGVGVVALFGLRGVATPMPLLTDPVEYINHNHQLHKDTKQIEAVLPGLSITEVWLKGSLGSVSEPEVLAGLHHFQQALEGDPDVGAAVGPTTILRMMRYIGGAGDQWPTDAEALNELAADLEGLVSNEPLVQRFVQKHSLAQTHVAVLSRAVEHEGFQRLDSKIKQHWQASVAKHPALKEFEVKTVGLGRLQAKMSQNLVPTLVESFALTAGIIFLTFLVVFRSGAARLMTMIPSLFAILVMFAVMRGSGMLLNVATILIASTVLGTSENDQIHFFYHFLEKRGKGGSVEASLRHTFRIAGRAILYATLINAGGFLAFLIAELPPMRQFGALSALALALSMLADFTALPAALWIIFREKPDAPAK
jgi:uncharacterized protein